MAIKQSKVSSNKGIKISFGRRRKGKHSKRKGKYATKQCVYRSQGR